VKKKEIINNVILKSFSFYKWLSRSD